MAQIKGKYIEDGTIDETKLDTSTNDSLNLADTALQSPLSGDIDFNDNNITDVKGVTFKDGQEITWNADKLTLNVPTGLGPVLQVGQEMYVIVYNDTGTQIDNGKAVKVSSITSNYQSITLAKADVYTGFGNGVLMTTMDIPDGEVGFAIRTGQLTMNTNSFTLGSPLYLSATTAGELTNTSPDFPGYEIFIGGTVIKDATVGVINVNARRAKEDTFENFWNGTCRENMDLLVTSDGSTITGSLSASDSADTLTLLCEDGWHLLDVSTPVTVTITAGTAINPQKSYIYILCSDYSLNSSTSGYPTASHIPVAEVVVQTAALTATDGALQNKNINNDLADDEGHVVHLGTRIRLLEAQWDSGVEGTLTGLPTHAYVQTTEGVVYQMHAHTYPAKSMPTNDMHIVNHPTAYTQVTDLKSLTTDANGDSLNDTSFSIVVWGIANKTGETSQLMGNLPTSTYSKYRPERATADALNYSVYEVPKIFQGTGFLIARFTFINNGGTWTLYATEDLRGKIPNTSAGGGAGGTGVTTFLGLTDTPSTFGTVGQVPVVNAGATALEFSSVGQGDVVGPATAVDDNLASFNLTTGKLIQDSGKKLTELFIKASDDADNIDDSTSANKFVVAGDITNLDNLSGTNSGDNAVNSNYSSLVTNATHSGDATGSDALTLATVNTDVGAYTNANITVNGKGLITAAANGNNGDVSKVGTPVDNQVGVWTGNGTIEGTTGLTYDGTTATVTGAITLTEAMNVASDKKLNLEGSGGDTYFIYNSATSKVELFVNGAKKADWG